MENAERAARLVEIGRRIGEAEGLHAAVEVADRAAKSYENRHGAVLRTLSGQSAWSYAAAARPTLEMLQALRDALEEAGFLAEERAVEARKEALRMMEPSPLWLRALSVLRGAASGWRASASRM